MTISELSSSAAKTFDELAGAMIVSKNYNGYEITFNKGENLMINATEMAKPFGKLAKDWLSNKGTNEFIRTLSAVRTIPLTELVVIKQGGNGEQGTWMHEDVALEFARWLSPQFAIWTNDRIKELLTQRTSPVRNLSRKELAMMVIHGGGREGASDA